MNSNESYQQRFGRLQKRKESRIFLNKDYPVIAECKTEEYDFDGIVQNLSAGGIFIETNMPSSIGQEIAFTFTLPSTQKTIKATGVIVRKTLMGIGVNIKIIFRD